MTPDHEKRTKGINVEDHKTPIVEEIAPGSIGLLVNAQHAFGLFLTGCSAVCTTWSRFTCRAPFGYVLNVILVPLQSPFLLRTQPLKSYGGKESSPNPQHICNDRLGCV